MTNVIPRKQSEAEGT